MILAQANTALAFLIIAADFSAIHGGWAHALDIPFSALAQHSYALVPLAALAPCVLPRRIPAWLRILGCDLLALGIVLFPILVFSLGSRGVTFSGEPSSDLTRQLRAELGFPVLMVQDSHGAHLYFSRDQEPGLIHDALRRHQLRPDT
ncbi:MAG: hypothetical protein V4662_04430 [Verrucomicrobiota bacterium]